MASTYDLTNYDSDEARNNDPDGPPRLNLFAAANMITRMLTYHQIQYAVMGGFALICRGSARTTRDVDVVTSTTMKTLWSLVEPQPR
jgi:hypothetical protein